VNRRAAIGGTNLVSPRSVIASRATHFLLMVALVIVTGLSILVASARSAFAQDASGAPDGAAAFEPTTAACLLDATPLPSSTAKADAAIASTAALTFFWGVGCPHCEEAKPFVDALEKEEPRLRVERIEVRQDPEGRKRFVETMKRLGVTGAGVPTFVVGDAYGVGYVKGETDEEVRGLVRRALGQENADAGQATAPRPIRVPWIGTVDPATVPLPALTLTMGLVDGVNPCAMWVLMAMMGILLHVKQRRRMVLYATVFVLTSGVVYFVFMTAWAALFQLVGFSRIATMILGGALLVMGLINLKELVWFKKGLSLMVPDKAKPGLFRRMRGIAGAASLPAALGGILALAFVVNLIELACTIGLPAVYTRVLTVRDLSAGARYAYLALYNVAYIMPLLAIALAFIALRRRLTMSERAAKMLKAISGGLLTLFGLLFLLVPELLLGS
jgi:thiol-disulfide isomerase/thioredoxin